MLHEWGIEGRFFSPLHDKAQKKIKPCIIVPRGFTDAILLLEESLGFLNTDFDYGINLISLIGKVLKAAAFCDLGGLYSPSLCPAPGQGQWCL